MKMVEPNVLGDLISSQAYKVPDRWCVMEQLPKTSTGKLDRKALHLNAKTEARDC